MEKTRKFYLTLKPELVTDENRSHYKTQIQKAAKDFVEANNTFKRLMTEFQELKLFEAFGEAAPQAVLQFAIILQLGYITPVQILTIITSLFSFSLASTEIFLMMKTKRKEIKEASWKETFILVLPVMAFIVIPRILSSSLIAAYSKQYFLLFICFMIFANILCNIPHFQRDPGQVFLGILTNVFAPCIVLEEGSGFYKRSGVISSILHILSGIFLVSLVVTQVIVPCPDFDRNIYPPILHCYPGNFSEKFGSMARCNGTSLAASSCMIGDKIGGFYDNTTDCIDDMLPIEWTIENEKLFRVTFCNIEFWWLPLLITVSVLVILQIISVVIILVYLDRIIDPINMFKVSTSCFPANMFAPVWNERHENVLKPIKNFLQYPNEMTLRAGNLIDLSIENDFHQIINMAINEMENPLVVDEGLLSKAIEKGSVKTIKMIINRSSRTTSNLRGINKLINECRQTAYDTLNSLPLKWILKLVAF